jgi:hypothetical protein
MANYEKYGAWAFVGYAYDALLDDPNPFMRKTVDEAYWALGIRGGNLEALYWVMKAQGCDFGEDDKHLRPPVTEAGAEEYEDILAGEEIWSEQTNLVCPTGEKD